MKSGQYIVVTHNDAIILNSNILYGVSMHEGVSKILSLKVNENQQPPKETQTNTENPAQ
jgi:chromosome segregation ATPase